MKKLVFVTMAMISCTKWYEMGKYDTMACAEKARSYERFSASVDKVGAGLDSLCVMTGKTRFTGKVRCEPVKIGSVSLQSQLEIECE